MANRRAEPVGYTPFQANPILSDGLLSVQRDDGALERKVAQGLANMADQFGKQADQETIDQATKQSQAGAFSGAPGASTITGGQLSGATASVNGQAGHVRGAQGGIVVRVPPQQIRTLIADAAVRHGVDPNALTQFAGIESSFNPASYNSGSGASGLFQFVPGTARQYGLSDPFDPAQSADAAARLMRDNTVALQRGLGRAPTAGELYLAHQQGVGGALKLLKNPDANAAQLVGEKAVASNGGSIGMTAAQFASMWTSKVSGGSASYVDPVVATNHPSADGDYAKLPSPASVAPISVTPVRTPVEITPGKLGTWRPREGNTLYDRAWNVAGTKTYLQMLDLAIMQDGNAVYEAYKDDPAQLQEALGQLKARHLRDDVFPEIAADYERVFARHTHDLVQKSQTLFDERKRQQDRVDFLGRVQTFEDMQSQRLAGMQPNDPTAATALADQQRLIDEHYDTAVVRGILSPAEAATAKARSRSDTTTNFYIRQAAGKSVDQIQSLRSEMASDYAGGRLAGVHADDWDAILKGLNAAESQRKTQDDLANAALEKRGKDISERVARGLPYDPADLAKFQLDIGTAPKGEEIARSTYMKIGLADALRKQPVAEVEQNLWSILGGDKSLVTPDDYDYAVKAIAQHKAEVQKDPLGVAERFGVVPDLGPLPDPNVATPDEMAKALDARILYADAAAKHFGVQPKYFRPEEEDAIKGAIFSTDLERHGAAMKELDVFAQKRSMLAVENQFGKDAADRLQDWQGQVRYSTPDEAAQWLKDRNDPKWQEISRPLVTKGKDEARKLTADQVRAMLGDNGWLSFSANAPLDTTTEREMMADFIDLSGERYAATKDVKLSQSQAIDRMRKVWGTSRVYGDRGGRLMMYPPEQHYPTVAGSSDWMADELADVAKQHGIDPAQMALVSDAKTKAAVERGEAPGYLLSSVDPKTGLEHLVTDDRGRPLRQFFDPKAGQERALAKAEEARRTKNDPWLVINRNTAIGPIYPNGYDPVQQRERQQRINEIMDARDKAYENGGKQADEFLNQQLHDIGIP